MKEMVRAAAVQMEVKSLSVEANIVNMRDMLDKIAAGGEVDLVVFPELASIGYIKGREEKGFLDFAKAYLKASQSIPGPFTDALGGMARKYRSYIICGMSGTHPTVPGTICNSAVLVDPAGEIISVYHKTHIPMEEKHYFYAGNSINVVSTELGNIGMMICADSAYPELARVLTLKGAEIICVPYCRPMTFGVDPETLLRIISCRALENSNFFIGSHRIGREGDQTYGGLSCICGPYGEFLARSELETTEDIVRATLNRDKIEAARMDFARFRDRRPDLYGILSQPSC
ncbi:carbon-nitrogen hydrolase family protein [Chloroflexota bacterium]